MLSTWQDPVSVILLMTLSETGLQSEFPRDLIRLSDKRNWLRAFPSFKLCVKRSFLKASRQTAAFPFKFSLGSGNPRFQDKLGSFMPLKVALVFFYCGNSWQKLTNVILRNFEILIYSYLNLFTYSPRSISSIRYAIALF